MRKKNHAYMKIKKHILTFLVLVGCVCANTHFSNSIVLAQDSSTSNEERTIRVGYYLTPGFQEYDADTDQYSGYSYEYLLALKQYTNWKYEFVPVEFSEGIEMLKNGEIDLMNNISITEDRQKYLSFSQYESGTNYACLVAKDDNASFAYEDFASFGKLKVGLLTTSIFNNNFYELCEENQFTPEICYYETNSEVDEALQKGEITARVVSSSYDMEGRRIIAKFAPMNYYFAVQKENTELSAELNEAMKCIQEQQPGLTDALDAKYYSKDKAKNVVLSDKEKQYLKDHKVVRVACTKSWFPLSYFDADEQYSGPLSRVYRRISETTGIQFEYVAYDNYTLALEAFVTGETDMLCEMPQDYIFADKFDANITDSIAPIGVYRVSKDKIETESIHKVAVLENTYIGMKSKEQFDDSSVEFVPYKTTEECVDAVNDGIVDCTYINTYQSYRYQSEGKYLQLKYVLIPDMQYNLTLATKRDTDGIELKSIVVKGLETISDEDFQQLFQDIQEDGTNKPDLEVLFYRNPILMISLCVLLAIIIGIGLGFCVYFHSLKKKNEELFQAKQKESAFLSRMSHDIRTPLNGIIGMTKLALIEDLSKDDYREYIEKIDSSGQYLKELVNNILDLKKIESDSLELKGEAYSLKELHRYVNAVIAPLCEEKKVHYSDKQFAQQEGSIITDKVRLNQILVNLLSNAVKYTNSEGEVSIYNENTMIENGEYRVDFVICDNGIGMSEEFQKHMFETFTQENTTTASGGSGLGLSIVKMLIDKMGGDIQIESTQGKGTKVIVRFAFPYVADTQIQEKVEELSEDFLEGKRILVCEDHPMNAEIARKLLERKKAIVTIAENGKIALEKFKESEVGYYNAILMDIRMPIMGGIEATQEIRAMDREDAKSVPIIAMTADAYDTDREKTLAAGMNAHLSKPIDVNVMYETLYHILSKKM